jgi:hypothetical protein
MEKLMPEDIERIRIYRRTYMKQYRMINDRSVSDYNTRQNPDYKQREILRMRKINERKKYFKVLPQFLAF